MTRKTILIILTISVGLFFLWTGFLWKIFSHGFAGSNPYVETWDLKATQKELFKIIKEIKHEHPELQPGQLYGKTGFVGNARKKITTTTSTLANMLGFVQAANIYYYDRT